MYVCMCYGITDKQVKNAVAAHGVGNMRELKQVMALGSQCGKCVEMAQDIIDDMIIDETMFMDVG